MILPRREDVLHKAQLYRVLISFLDNPILSKSLALKGGTCAAMMGWLDRFSVDLDFDLMAGSNKKTVLDEMKKVFSDLDMTIVSRARASLFFVVQYKAKPGLRNSLKIGVMEERIKANKYDKYYLSESDRYAICQTRETMVANKLVALTDRYKKHKAIAGRDLYDIHYFLSRGYEYDRDVIEERTGMKAVSYLKKLSKFIEEKITEKIITEDLSFLLPPKTFQAVRKTLKRETIILVEDEVRRMMNK